LTAEDGDRSSLCHLLVRVERERKCIASGGTILTPPTECIMLHVGMTFALLMISFTFFSKGEASSGFAVFGLALYLSFFSVGMGPGAWLVPSEIFASSIRAKAMSVATFSNRIVATLMASTFLSTAKAIGWAGFFLMLAIICIVVGCFLYFYLPETKGRSLEDMSVYFAEITNDTSLLDAEAKIIRMREEKVQAEGQVELTSSQAVEGTMA
jgi:MFS family permease